jgi:hypothetical protein
MSRHTPVAFLLVLAILSLHALCVNAQFGNIFQDVFGQQQQQQHAQQQHFQNHHGANVRGWQIQDEGEIDDQALCETSVLTNRLRCLFQLSASTVTSVQAQQTA